MINGKTILAVVPARGGSKGIPLKNVRPFAGVPLVARVGHLVQECDFFDRAVVSTDHPEIAAIARAAGLDAPFYRPEHLSGDFVGDLEVLQHALETMESLDGCTYDMVVMLQPTSPLRKATHVTHTVQKLMEGQWDAVWTLSATDSKHHPLKQLRWEGEGLALYDPAGQGMIARQQLAKLYHRNGAAYAFTRGCLVVQRTIMPLRWSGVVLDDPMVSIDTLDDLAYAEWVYFREQQKRQE